MPEQIPQEVLDAIRAALEETARRLAQEKSARPSTSAPTPVAQDLSDEEAPGNRAH
jgi:hypothetical protein